MVLTMYPSVILTHAGINGKIGRKLPREDMMGGTNDVPLDPKTEVMLENCPDGDIMESTDDVPLDPTYRQYDDQWKVVVLPPRRYEGKCENNDAPLALASANTIHLVIGAWCTQGALGLQSMRVRSTKRSR